MNHRAAGGVEIVREEQGTRRTGGTRETRAAMGGTGWIMDGLAGRKAGRQKGWKRRRVGAGRGGGDYGESVGDWEARSMAYCRPAWSCIARVLSQV